MTTVAIRVVDSITDVRYLVLTECPQGTAPMREEGLAALVMWDKMRSMACAQEPMPQQVCASHASLANSFTAGGLL